MKKFAFLILVGIVGAGFLYSKNFIQRNPASEPRLIGKNQRLLDVRISAVGGIPDSEEKDLVLRFRIQGTEPISTELFYTWVLPPEASLVSGELSDSISNLMNPKVPFEKEITIQGVSLEDASKVVVLQVYTEIDGVRIGNAAVFSPKPENLQTEKVFMGKSTVKSSPALPRDVKL